MDTATVKAALLWCCVINYALLILWAVLAVGARAWMGGMLGKMFRVSEERANNLNLVGITFYKLGITLFNLVPYLALALAGR